VAELAFKRTWKVTQAPLGDGVSHWELTDSETGEVLGSWFSDEPAENVFKHLVAFIQTLPRP
jgi:hypothetical protein